MNRLMTRYIVVHHSVSPQEWSQEQTHTLILASHKARGLAYDGHIAYHFLIGNEWEMVSRPIKTVGYHSGSWPMNLQSVAVCLTGNFNVDKPTKKQESLLRQRLLFLMQTYGLKSDRIILHRDVKATTCPGSNITPGYLRGLVATVVALITDARIKQLFKAIWQRDPATGDWTYFKNRLQAGTIEDEKDMTIKMAYWYGQVYPNGVYSHAGNEDWQRAKEKV